MLSRRGSFSGSEGGNKRGSWGKYDENTLYENTLFEIVKEQTKNMKKTKTLLHLSYL